MACRRASRYVSGRAPQLSSPVIGAGFKIGKYKPMLNPFCHLSMNPMATNIPTMSFLKGQDPKKSLIIGLCLQILRVIPVFSRIQLGGNGK
jgi:hypothetical protein